MIDSIPEPIRTALVGVVAALILAIGGYLVALLKALTRRAEGQAALDKSFLGEQQASAAVAAVDQTMSRDEEPEARLARAVELAPAATLAQIEAEVKARKGVCSDGTA